MKSLRARSKLIIGVAVAALAAGATAAVLATRGEEPRGAHASRQTVTQASVGSSEPEPTTPQATQTTRSPKQTVPKGKRAAPTGGRARRPRPAVRARGDLAVAASYLGISRARLREELRAGRPLAKIADGSPGKSSSGLIETLVHAWAARLGAAVAQGRLELSQERKQLATLHKRIARRVNAVPLPAGAASGDIAAAARYIGVSRLELRQELRAGRTLAQIAQATPGRSARGLIDALVTVRRARIAAAVAVGALTSKQEKALLASLEQRVAKRVSRPRRHPA